MGGFPAAVTQPQGSSLRRPVKNKNGLLALLIFEIADVLAWLLGDERRRTTAVDMTVMDTEQRLATVFLVVHRQCLFVLRDRAGKYCEIIQKSRCAEQCLLDRAGPVVEPEESIVLDI